MTNVSESLYSTHNLCLSLGIETPTFRTVKNDGTDSAIRAREGSGTPSAKWSAGDACRFAAIMRARSESPETRRRIFDALTDDVLASALCDETLYLVDVFGQTIVTPHPLELARERGGATVVHLGSVVQDTLDNLKTIRRLRGEA